MRDLGYSYLDQLNDVQRQAVTALQGPVMVIAGPGSGKTRVLTYRIAHLINNGVRPWEILALTFTNKAAREMKDRLEKVVGPQAYKVWAGTFHSIFAKILRREAHRIGYPNDFTIYDTDDSKSVINEIIKIRKLDKKTYNNGAVRARISAAKSNLITPKAYANHEDLMAYDRVNRRPLIYQIYADYAAKLKRAGAMDFDDLLLQTYRLLYTNPDGTREKYQAQFQYILVDEFQDTNHLQYEIIKLFTQYPGSKENICIVGDDAQSIYSFRGATIENILMFENDFDNVQIFKLEQNYRSTNFIVEAANTVIAHNKNQIPKKIWTPKNEGKKIKLLTTLTETEEGKRVADSIIEHKNRYNLRNSDIAILYRTNAQSRIFEEYLRRYNIKYRIYGGISFYQRKEIKDIIAYLRLIVNDKDDEALKRIINYPRRGIGKTTLDNLAQLAADNDMSMWDVLTKIDFSKRAKKSMVEFVKMMSAFKQRLPSSDAYELASYVVRKSGIADLLRADTSPEGISRVDNVNALLDAIKNFVDNDELIEGEEVEDKSLTSFLQTITLMTDADQENEDTDVVTLMSVHAAKGLEFKCVFVVGLEENLFPSFMSLATPGMIEEERRLFYVAITRAEEYLTLSHAKCRYHFGTTRNNDPSRFLDEIGMENIDELKSIRKKEYDGFAQPKILGNFKSLGRGTPQLGISEEDFEPSPPSKIKEGMKVLHLKFGEGKILSIDNRRVAKILFDSLPTNQEKRIMLNYAKLQILD